MTESIRDRKRPVRGDGGSRRGVVHATPGSRLSEHERAEVKALLDRGQPLPERYRHVLFAEPEAPRLNWAGKHGAEPMAPRPLLLRERYGLAEGAGPSGWRNRLILGDNGAALAALAEPPLRREIESAGGLKLIYIDPPFAAQQDFPMTLALGTGGAGPSPRVRVPAYADSWAGEGEAYLSLMFARLRAMHALLAEDGFLFLHCDWRSAAHLRLMLDELFGRECFVNEIVWHYYNKYSAGRRCLPRSHDTILLYAKHPARAGKLNPLRLPREVPVRQLVRENVNGVLKNARDAQGRLRYREVSDRKLSDVWEIPQLQPASGHWSGYPTQKHPALLERILALCTQEGDLVADFFAGSGTLPVVAQALGRRWIACDAAPVAIHTARKRLLAPAQGPVAGFDLLEVDDSGGLPLGGNRGGEVSASLQRGSGGITVTLTGYTPAPLDAATAGLDGLALSRGRLVRRGRGGRAAEILTRDWSDWIDYWAVGVESADGEGIAPLWWTLRPLKPRGTSRALPLTSPPLALPKGAGRVKVLAVDPFGRVAGLAIQPNAHSDTLD